MTNPMVRTLGVCMAALTLPLSGCTVNHDAASPIPIDNLEHRKLPDGLSSLKNLLTSEPLSGDERKLLPPEVRSTSLRKAVPTVSSGQGIVAGRIYDDNCLVLYNTKRGINGNIGVIVGTNDKINGAQEFILDNLTGEQARSYPMRLDIKPSNPCAQ